METVSVIDYSLVLFNALLLPKYCVYLYDKKPIKQLGDTNVKVVFNLFKIRDFFECKTLKVEGTTAC